MTHIDDILERLKGQQPMLENPDEMVENIMACLPDMEEHGASCKGQETRSEGKETAPKQSAILIALRIITSAAAIWLIGLFIYVNQPVKTEASNAQANTIDHPQGNTLENMYTRCMRTNQSKSISYTQFKQMLYAKN
ncbi:MAG: hypothetical protein II706_00090 [Bacteroidaceae bacterium]|jgi:hypothetical protein|nr:hypothetical protein [Bacteroidaceae bacterium]